MTAHALILASGCPESSAAVAVAAAPAVAVVLALSPTKDFHVVISPLLSPGLQHFRVLMAAARDPFVDPSMAQSTNIGEVLVWLPFGAVICIGAIYWIMSKVKERRKMSRVHAKPEEKPPPLPGGSPTHSPDSGMAMLRLKQ
eukprot:TRINITY_DN14933_c1_g1_i4.p1 TRINITY_DN14933_c1_g1~~TRINITY_DN14933_c1_g1_i4.p1  ORF type:complete len:142 (-),score=17.13 TRINITY_DN14933_c1_g1_i4:169-594(-)